MDLSRPQYSEYAEYADYAEYAEYAEYLKYVEYAKYAKYAEYAEYAEYAKYAEYAEYTKYAEYEVQSPISSFNLADLFSPRIWSSLFSSTFHIHFWSEFVIHRVDVISCCVIYNYIQRNTY